MAEEKKDRMGNCCSGKGSVSVVGIGPGGLEHLTDRAKAALTGADCIVGYTRYVDLIKPIVEGKELFSTGMTHEVQRCGAAIEFARLGKKVAVVSSGDSGIYGMAGLILQLAYADKELNGGIHIEVIPGIPAFVSAASILGAPLMHDFASISLSDLLTDWEKIEERVEAAAKADFVTILYNPKSTKRIEGLTKAIGIISRYRENTTPVGLVRNASRQGEEAIITTLGEVEKYFDNVDMLTILIIGNSATFTDCGHMITPRGYKVV